MRRIDALTFRHAAVQFVARAAGRDALVRVAVALLSAKKPALLACFAADAAKAVVDDALALRETPGGQERAIAQSPSRKAAARLLGISFRSLRYRLQKLGLAGDDAEEPEPEPSA